MQTIATIEDRQLSLAPEFIGAFNPGGSLCLVYYAGRANQAELTAEMLIHFSALRNLDKPDYEKIAAAAVQGMNAADLNRFLVVCALVSDLYCPGFNPRQSLEKDSNLARAAARYKVDSGKIGAAVRAELSKTKNEAARQSQPAKKLSTAKSSRPKQSK